LHIHEIPALLEWKDYKHKGQRVKRQSSSRVKRLIMSHSLFSLFANPVRYVWTVSLLSMVLGVVSLIAATIFRLLHMDAAYTALLGVSLVIVAIVLFVLGVVVRQGNMIQRELWVVQRFQIAQQKREAADPRVERAEVGMAARASRRKS
jgi:hypothetical protein